MVTFKHVLYSPDLNDASRCDLVVMGTQGRGGASLAFFGSTTSVVRSATAPVRVVRSPAASPSGAS